jgi:hypothetical protein
MFMRVLFAGICLAFLILCGSAKADCPYWCGPDDPTCDKARARGDCQPTVAPTPISPPPPPSAPPPQRPSMGPPQQGSRESPATTGTPPAIGAGRPGGGYSYPSSAPSRPAASPPPSGSSRPTASRPDAPTVVIPSRAFLPPHDIPPKDFAAYGIVAFPQEATPSTTRRHISICEAFVATLPAASSTNLLPKQQMVTVWPVESASLAARLEKGKPDCKIAVQNYHLPTALTALKQARTQERTAFSLAWAPSSTKGKKDALVLIADLSDVRTATDFLNRFRAWRNEIEKKPELWQRGWSEPDLVTLLRRWADKWGTMVLSIGRSKDKDDE